MNPIVKEAYTWLGTPHINQAKVKGRGIDCGMLLIACLEGAGYIKEGEIKIPAYSNEWHLHHSEEWFLKIVERYCAKIPPEEIKPGDFILYKFGRCVSHGAVYIGNHQVIHARVDHGVIMTGTDDVMFLTKTGQSRFCGVYRFRRG